MRAQQPFALGFENYPKIARWNDDHLTPQPVIEKMHEVADNLRSGG